MRTVGGGVIDCYRIGAGSPAQHEELAASFEMRGVSIGAHAVDVRHVQASARGSARSLDLRAADHGGLAVGMHVAERERVVAVELSVPEAVGIGEDEALVVLAG